jgi:hypothetical protein
MAFTFLVAEINSGFGLLVGERDENEQFARRL